MPIIGHEKIISYFDKVIANNALSQSYCFVGSEGVGKKAVARYLASKILKVSDKQLDTHPDFYYICRQVDEKTEKIKKEIGIIQARQIKEKLGRSSWFGGYQVIIIDEAELLNEESGNALLKSLEEAGGKWVFFLLTSDDGELLSTIRSRCQMFYFPLIDVKIIEAELLKLGYDANLASEAAKMSWGRPGRAVALAADENLRNQFKVEVARWEKIEGAPFYEKIKAMDDLFNEKIDNIRTSEKLDGAIRTWTVLWREKFLDKMQNKFDKKNDLSLTEMADLIDSFKKAQVLLSQNINPRLIIEQILFKV